MAKKSNEEMVTISVRKKHKKHVPTNVIKLGRIPKHSDDELADFAIELMEWAEDNNTAISFHEFIIEMPFSAELMHSYSKRSEIFRLAVKMAKSKIKVNRDRLACSGALPLPMWQKTDHYFDDLLKFHDEEIKDLDSERKKKENASLPTNDSIITADLELRKEIAMLKKQLQEYKQKLAEINA